MSEAQSLTQFCNDAPVADRRERRWLVGPQVTTEDLKRGTGIIQRVTAKEWFAAAAEMDGTASGARSSSRAKPKGPLIFPLGIHKGKLAIDVKENEPGYWAWSIRTVAWWGAKARGAGLVDDEETEEAA